jgi:DNA-binding FadR family transcriptional regulator
MPGIAEKMSTTGAGGANRTASRVYDHVFDGIATGDYAKGQRLPTEQELGRRFEVSRSVVREALVRLRDEGLIESRRGAGSFVIAGPDQAIRRFAPVSSISDIQRCYEFRIFIEEGACGLAALRRDKEAIAELESRLLATEGVDDDALGVEADLEFHIAIAKASRNRFFVDTLMSLRSHLLVGMGLVRRLSMSRPEDSLQLMYREHREILAAIVAGDVDRATRAMQVHLESTRKRLFEG